MGGNISISKNEGGMNMCRTIVGVSANLCPVDPEGKNLHSSVSSQFAEGIRQAGGLPMVIPMGDPSLVKDYVETIDKLILSGGQNVDPSLYGEEKPSRAMITISNGINLSLPY